MPTVLLALFGANATESNTFLQTLAGPVYIPSYEMPMACRTHNLQAQNHYHRRRDRHRHRLHPRRRKGAVVVVAAVVVVSVFLLFVVVVSMRSCVKLRFRNA